MSDQDLIKAAHSVLDGFNNKDWNSVRNALGPKTKMDEVGTGSFVEGQEGVVANFQNWAKAFPDSKAVYGNNYVSGNTVIDEITWIGKHTGPMMSPNGEIPATNKPIEIRAAFISHVENGKVNHISNYFDMLTLMKQLGLV